MTASLSTVLDAHAVRTTERIFTALPGVVKKFNPATNCVDVQVALKVFTSDSDGTPVYQAVPVLSEVPIMYPRGGGFICSFPLSVGDSVLLVFNTLDAGAWELSGQAPVEPLNTFRHGLSSCVAVPGYFPDITPPNATDLAKRTTNLCMGKEGGVQMQVTSTDEVHLGGTSVVPPTDFVALASLVQAGFNYLHTYINAHVHTSAAPGSPTTPPTIGSDTQGPFAAAKVRAK